MQQENRALLERIETQESDKRDENEALILQLEESVRLSCALRAQLAAAQQALAGYKLQFSHAKTHQGLQEEKVQDPSLGSRDLASQAPIPEETANAELGAAVCGLMQQNREMVSRISLSQTFCHDSLFV